jgi:hypothetical protein
VEENLSGRPQRVRNQIEEAFGWIKTRRTGENQVPGRERVGWAFPSRPRLTIWRGCSVCWAIRRRRSPSCVSISASSFSRPRCQGRGSFDRAGTRARRTSGSLSEGSRRALPDDLVKLDDARPGTLTSRDSLSGSSWSHIDFQNVFDRRTPFVASCSACRGVNWNIEKRPSKHPAHVMLIVTAKGDRVGALMQPVI